MDFDAWMGEAGRLAALPTQVEESRAVAAWRRIQDKPTSLAFRTTSGTTLAAQTVRVEWDNTVSEAEGAGGTGPRRKLVVFGIKGHPTLPDTNIKEGYRVVMDGDALRCVDLIYTLGEVQAIFESSG